MHFVAASESTQRISDLIVPWSMKNHNNINIAEAGDITFVEYFSRIYRYANTYIAALSRSNLLENGN